MHIHTHSRDVKLIGKALAFFSLCSEPTQFFLRINAINTNGHNCTWIVSDFFSEQTFPSN
jgi:hypothetical protein